MPEPTNVQAQPPAQAAPAEDESDAAFEAALSQAWDASGASETQSETPAGQTEAPAGQSETATPQQEGAVATPPAASPPPPAEPEIEINGRKLPRTEIARLLAEREEATKRLSAIEGERKTWEERQAEIQKRQELIERFGRLPDLAVAIEKSPGLVNHLMEQVKVYEEKRGELAHNPKYEKQLAETSQALQSVQKTLDEIKRERQEAALEAQYQRARTSLMNGVKLPVDQGGLGVTAGISEDQADLIMAACRSDPKRRNLRDVAKLVLGTGTQVGAPAPQRPARTGGPTGSGAPRSKRLEEMSDEELDRDFVHTLEEHMK